MKAKLEKKLYELIHALEEIQVYMPNMNGIEFVIRVREAFPEAKIVGLSGEGFLSKGSARQLPTGCRHFRILIQCLPTRPVP